MSFINKVLNMLPDLDFADENGNTILHQAVIDNNKDMVITIINKILETDENILNKQNNDGDTAFHIAISNNNNDLASLLDEAGTDKSIKNNKGEYIEDMTDAEELQVVDFQFDSSKCKNDLNFIDVLYAISNTKPIIIDNEPIIELKPIKNMTPKIIKEDMTPQISKEPMMEDIDPFLEQLLTEYISQRSLQKGGSQRIKKVIKGTRKIKH